MEITVIIILSLLVLLIFTEMLRESQQKKWYRRGYIDASMKYDGSPNSKEADDKFDEDYGFLYD